MPRVTSDDPDFLAGLTAAVSVELDANRTGGVTSPAGGAGPDYRPVVGLESEPCRVVDRAAQEIDVDGRRLAVKTGRCLFGASVDLGPNHRLAYADPVLGRVRYLYVKGASRNAHEMNHHWVCDWVEYLDGRDPS